MPHSRCGYEGKDEKEDNIMQSVFEKNGGTYRQEGCFLIPNLEVPKTSGTIGKYGRLHKKFLKQNYPVYYSALFMTGKLFGYLKEIDLKAPISSFEATIMSQVEVPMILTNVCSLMFAPIAPIWQSNAPTPTTTSVVSPSLSAHS